MATEQTPWPSREKTNGSSYPEAGGKKRRLRGKRRWPPKVAGESTMETEIVGPTDPARIHAMQRHEAANEDVRQEIVPAGAAGGEEQTLIDPELIRVLQSLSSTIDTAHHVLYAAAEATQRQAHEPRVQQAYQAEGPNGYQRTRRGPPPLPPVPPEATPPSSRGLKFATAATALIVLGAIGWTIHANPWLLGGETQSASMEPDATNQMAAQMAAKPQEPGTSMKRVAEVPKPTLSAALSVPKPPVAETPAVAPAALEAPVQPAQVPRPVPPTRRIAHTVRGLAERPIPLGLEAPQRTGDTELSAMIQGAPEEVSLSAGQHIGGGTWIVEANEIEGLTATAPRALVGRQFTLEVTLVTSDGKIPEARTLTVAVASPPESQSTVVRRTTAPASPQLAIAKEANEPASVPARGSQGPQGSKEAAQPNQNLAPIKNRLSKEVEARLMKRGSELLNQRDISAARLIFEHAARLGSATAMVALARTYDPGYLAKLGIPGVKGDQSQAAAWYERAAREADQ